MGKKTALTILLLGVLHITHLAKGINHEVKVSSKIIQLSAPTTAPTTITPAPTTITPAPTTITPAPTTITPAIPRTDQYLGPEECLDQKYTRLSCHRVFCPPWMRCMEGRCVCKLPYLCPKDGMAQVCGHDGRTYLSYCQAMAVSCRSKQPIMSHFGGGGCSKDSIKAQTSIDEETGVVSIVLPIQGKLLVCGVGGRGGSNWNMAAANVACYEKSPWGAKEASSVLYKTIKDPDANHCVSILCQGYENSLTECSFSGRTPLGRDDKVATATCYHKPKEGSACEFRCVNDKCVSLEQTCDGVDHCGDRSDEMCCTACRGDSAFWCKSGVCLSKEAVEDGIMDCLGGEDEMSKHITKPVVGRRGSHDTRVLEFISPKQEVKAARDLLEGKVYCGIPNNTVLEESDRGEKRKRQKRVVGGVPAQPTQIQWQVAIQEGGKIDCGGAYIGGCWVLTAAHCVRPKPEVYSIKFSLWKKRSIQGTTDIVPVKNIIIHHKYNANTYENDIALIEMEKLPFKTQCLEENPAVSAVCVPWSVQLFNPNHTCSISGWGRKKDGSSSDVLLWANVSLIANCQGFYGPRYYDGMMCAGDLEGHVDSCQGDSGGPLVCQDSLGVSYLWGIVSWGEKCGQAKFPGVYTKVAHYFDWIRTHTGWAAVTKYNL
ncbi:complement factor I isoform X1 [Oncorhynchus mykiss]|uniref:complement factor I isoform X1 n=1 Tax=Oncorhynchus mykiss TaxID=8022 RepID=UPI001878B38A|nr:complement factor I isoform X1 [Oncorhynchus mykiss]XP_036829563.1 complement factor I isoform X1 [Oncorhynchus mykiss]XP_036829564.1 complement factor I isoform X1 [Oncorhynchus mykiss]